jgi:PAS domain S-box-containing protein
MLGVLPEELVGASVLDCVAPASRKDVAEHLRSSSTTLSLIEALRADGSTFPAEVIGRNVEYRGRPARAAVVRDVSDRAAVEQSLRESEERFRKLIEHSADAILLVDGTGTITYQSPSAERVFGYTDEESQQLQPFETVHPEDRDRVRDLFAEVVAEPGRLATAEYRVRASDGGWRWVQTIGQNMLDDPAVAAIVANVRDITETRASDEALRAAEAYERTLFERNPVAIWVWDIETWRFLDVNEACEQQYGYSREEFLRMTAFDLRPPQEHARLREAIAGAGPQVRNFGVWRHRRKDGTLLDVEVHSSEITYGGQPARISLAIDVTEKLRAERAVREAEERYRALVESLPAVIFRDQLDAETNVYISPQVEQLLGYPMSEWERDPDFWRTVVHPGDRERIFEGSRKHSRELAPFTNEFRLVARDGRTVWIFEQSTPVYAEDGTGYWQGVWLDVTDRHHVDAARKEAEERYRMVVENASDLVALIAPDGTFVYVSPSHTQVLGYTEDQLIGTNAFLDEGAGGAGLVSRTIDEVMRSGKGSKGHRFRRRHKDGHWVELEDSGWQPIFDDDGNVKLLLAVSRDITERIRGEEERRAFLSRLVAAQEQERYRIAGGVHDDSVQAMTAVALRLSLLRSKLGDESSRQELDKLEGSVNRAVGRLRHLLFELHPRTLDQDGLVSAIREYLRRLSDEGSPTLGFRVTDRLDREPSSPHRLILYRIAQEALTNVWKHANAYQVDVTIEPREGGVLLRIEDDGTGLPAREVLERPGHLGLDAMRERAELAGGWWHIGPGDDGGTVVETFVPGEGDGSPART